MMECNNAIISAAATEADAYAFQLDKRDVVLKVSGEKKILKYVDIGNEGRYGYVYVPPQPNGESVDTAAPNKTNKILFYYHGSRTIALADALVDTNLLRSTESKGNNIIIFFGQSSGRIQPPTVHPKYKDTTYGDLYWGLHESQSVDKDIEYTRLAYELMRSMFSHIDDYYFWGYSNGGVFALLVAVYFIDVSCGCGCCFKGIVSYNGGIGFDDAFVIPFDLLEESQQKCSSSDQIQKTRILFYTSDKDVHRSVCEQGHELFKNMGYDSTFMLSRLSDCHQGSKDGHAFCPDDEPIILDWICLRDSLCSQ